MKVSVIGAGVMGPGIVQSWLQAGYRIDLCDIDEKALSRARHLSEKLGINAR